MRQKNKHTNKAGASARRSKRKAGAKQLGINYPALIGYGSLGALMLVGGLLLCPTSPDGVSADEIDCTVTPNAACESASAQTEVVVNNRSAIAMALQDANIGIEVRSELFEDGMAFAHNNTSLSVSTNSSKGYAVYLSTSTEDPALVSEASTGGSAIKPLTTAQTKDSFEENAWGYAISANGGTVNANEASYRPVAGSKDTNVDASNMSPVAKGDTATKGDTYDLSFATALTTDFPAGVYSNSVVVSVLANPVTLIKTLQDITTMQEMTSEICKNTVQENDDGTTLEKPAGTTNKSLEGTVFQATLKDTRDDKTYRVAKLADGNCWMTSDLQLDLATGTSLTAADTDLGEVTVGGVVKGNYTWAPQYNTATSAATNGNQTANATASWHLAANTPSYEWNGSGPGNVNGHLDVDRWYYQYNAATAGTGSTDYIPNTGTAQGSICPKGWRLPANGEYGALINTAYGIPSATSGSNVDAKLLQEPLKFFRTGDVWSGVFYSAGVGGLYWSATAASATNAYNLAFHSSYLNPSNSHNRADGFSLRCVAR